MTFLRTLAPLAALSTGALAGPKSCPSDTPLSCHNNTIVADTCCFIPAGQLLLTQFWDARPATGPSDSWTIHGLWPDHCDGTYPAKCDPSREYDDIGSLVSEQTLAYMNKYWKDNRGDDESFWQHEWNKHGTCVSTLEPRCYGDYQPKEEVGAYFDRTVALFKTLPTYEWLAEAGIKPSASKKYDIDAIQEVLERKHGAKVTLGCKGKVLNEVWYHFNVRGSLQEGKFVAAMPDGTKSTCPPRVQYEPKGRRRSIRAPELDEIHA
ncbi:Ribonuclease Trv [Drechmeria coniospora]|uniref:ribonuclease T2 n=1 Tax=Drechmeria coniospora TaxID=98403 RepID=A0A151GIM3_DRECN|nr:Ribonuclease Trv [Drechmeria coniospora]KYK56947.1 Ribonuclease Trv [Drechmeria coniospora]ODA80417.1 hypothetical protein RJ55_03375 [Drechmeria coniospora]